MGCGSARDDAVAAGRTRSAHISGLRPGRNERNLADFSHFLVVSGVYAPNEIKMGLSAAFDQGPQCRVRAIRRSRHGLCDRILRSGVGRRDERPGRTVPVVL